MKRSASRHHTEEELLMHFLGEETPDVAREISSHLRACGECESVFQDYAELVGQIQSWIVPEVPEGTWQKQQVNLMARCRQDFAGRKLRGFMTSLSESLRAAWNYALEHPLPTLAYIAVAIAFALERTITTFRLDRILPGANEVFQILRQVF